MLPSDGARYDCDPASSLAAIAVERGVSPAAAFIELVLETDGALVANMPFLNQDLGAVEAMLDDPLVTLGLADAGAHVGQIMDASQPTFLLTYWIRERSVGASRKRCGDSPRIPPICSASPIVVGSPSEPSPMST